MKWSSRQLSAKRDRHSVGHVPTKLEIEAENYFAEQSFTTTDPPRRVALVGVTVDGTPEMRAADSSLDELAQLSASAGYQVAARFRQHLRRINPAFLIGKGKVAEVSEGRASAGYDTLIFDTDLTPNQQSNLEKATSCQVMDRSALILVIFGQRARTYEGRLQVELAQMEYLLPRLAGRWPHLSRQFGRAGVRGGPGETQIEVDRRIARRRISELKRQIEGVRRHRSLHRQRRESTGVPQAALVGYTNAGKSTLLNRLTGADVTIADQLFSTLDPTTRQLTLSAGLELLLSDTVGFIHDLPPTLIAAFRATLEELESADLILHVVDISHPQAEMHLETVSTTLDELNLSATPIVTALNKMDNLGDPSILDQLERDRQSMIAEASPESVLVSAITGYGIGDLKARIERVLGRNWPRVSLSVPIYNEHLAWEFTRRAAEARIERKDEEILLEGRLPARYWPRFGAYETL